MLCMESKEHSILREAKAALRDGRKLYIYGAAEAGVSVFHIRSLCPDYRLYLRAHERRARELV